MIKAINEVKSTFEAKTYGVDPNVQVVIPELVFPIKVTVHTSALETGREPTPFDDAVK